MMYSEARIVFKQAKHSFVGPNSLQESARNISEEVQITSDSVIKAIALHMKLDGGEFYSLDKKTSTFENVSLQFATQ